VLYHHFPGGKTALAVAAIEDSVRRLCDQLDAMLATGQPLIVVLEGWLAAAERRLARSDYAAGCPLATVALESTPQDPEIRAAVDAGFSAIRQRIAAALRAQGRSPGDAEALAALIVSAYEGGLMQARVAGNTEAMTRVGQALHLLLAAPGSLAASPGKEPA
jgi:TetR/AcrR family transcriptional repressor of lmrAB and yxaGH operons